MFEALQNLEHLAYSYLFLSYLFFSFLLCAGMKNMLRGK